MFTIKTLHVDIVITTVAVKLSGTEAQRFNSHLEIGDTVWCAVG